ncbi:MAG TPA: BatA and WFA domain-containing protein [Ignavibacteria bacterium]|nr:BatA and WFA domain-containing protein [Ignavibacteria bacterium]
MNFLNPAALIALFAVSIPILIHLLNLRKLKKIDFSTLMFLKEIQKSKMRRIKLKQLLLLALRIGIITLLVLTFAKPVYEGYSFNNDAGGKSTVLIFIDDSFSMDASDVSGQYFSQAKNSVKEILNNYKESDEIILIPSSFTGYKNSIGINGGKKEITDSLEQLKLSNKPFYFNDALIKAGQILDNSINPNKDVFVISDFQRINGGVSASEIKTENYEDVNFILINTGERTSVNLSLDSFKVNTKIPAKFGNIRVSVNLSNHSPDPVSGISLKLFLNDKLTEETSADVSANSSNRKEFSFTAEKAGDLHGFIELSGNSLQNDEFDQDNRIYFDVFIPEKINVGMIGNSNEFRFINTVLNSAQDLSGDNAENNDNELFEINLSDRLDESIFSNDVLLISSGNNYSDRESELLSEFLSAGKGIFIFPNEYTDIQNFNSEISSKLYIPQIGSFNTDENANKNLKFGKIDFENPIMSEIFRNNQLNITSDSFLDSPGIKKFYELLLNDKSIPVIMLSDGKPFITETELPKGKMLLSAVSGETGFSDFPLNNIFPPLIIRSIFFLNSDFGFSNENYIGASNIIPVKGLNNIFSITTPENNTIELNTELSGSSNDFYILPYTETAKDKGLYLLKDSSGNQFGVSLNIDSRESDPGRMDDEEIVKYFNNAGIADAEIISNTNEISVLINNKRTGTSLWKFFLIAALILLAAEIFYSKKLEE